MASGVSAELLKRLSVASEGLNNASDIFNEQIKIIEEALASYNLGIMAWAPACQVNETEYDDNGVPAGVYPVDISVGYEKWQGKWCLKAASYSPIFDERQEWVLKDAPRERRIQAIEGIPALLEKLIAEAQKLTSEVAKKTADARSLAVSIKPKKGQ